MRKNANRFDVLDCLIGTLPVREKIVGLCGFICRAFRRAISTLRSVSTARAKTLAQPMRGHWYGPLLHRFLEWRNTADSEATIRGCDLIIVPNEDERIELEQGPPLRARIIVEPYALSDGFREALTRAAVPAGERLSRQTICFIGMWGPRKGAHDWSKIILTIRQKHPAMTFLFLGTMSDDQVVFADLEVTEGISCRQTFAESELPALLSHCTVGVFPSYIEGFGLAVLEQLAAGLPTIAYDVPGPRQILEPLRDRLLVPVGDVATLAASAGAICDLSAAEYDDLSKECVAIAVKYRWTEVAARTIEAYQTHLRSLGNTF